MEIDNRNLLYWSPLIENIQNYKEELLQIIAPFIQLDALKIIISNSNIRNLKIITRWNANDIISGVSDLNIYPYLKEKKINLYIHKTIHLKLILFKSNVLFHSSGNITKTGLGIGHEGNIEVGSFIKTTFNDWKHLYNLIEDSFLVTDEIYEIAQNYLNEFKEAKEPLPELNLYYKNDIRTETIFSEKPFSISSLPATNNPNDLLNFIIGVGIDKVSMEDIRKIFHDINLLNLEIDNKSNIKNDLISNFKQLSFIISFIEYLKSNISLNFGAVSNWVHNKCTDVPLPYRWEIKLNISCLYNWLAFCYEEISWNRPKHSQVINWNRHYVS